MITWQLFDGKWTFLLVDYLSALLSKVALVVDQETLKNYNREERKGVELTSQYEKIEKT